MNLEVLLRFLGKLWSLLEIPDTGEMLDEDSKVEKINALIIYCLSLDPNDTKLRGIRIRALSVLLKTHYLSDDSSVKSKELMNTLVQNLMNDQDKNVRLKVIQKITKHFQNSTKTTKP